MPRLVHLSLATVLVFGSAFGCDGDPDPPDPDDASDGTDADVIPADDTARTDSSQPSDTADTTSPDSDTSDPDTSGPTDTDSTRDADSSDTVGSSLDLVHVPPECTVTGQSCSLTIGTDTQTGLKVQVLKGTSGVQGETIGFQIESGGSLASLGSNEATTDPMGRAGVQFTTGSQAGNVRVKAWIKNSPAEPVYWDVTIQK